MPNPCAVCRASLRVCSLRTSPSTVGEGKLLTLGNLRAVLDNPLMNAGVVTTAFSEETPTEDPMGGEDVSVALVPLDGSSIIDTNFAVGTISGIWPVVKYVMLWCWC